MKPKIFLILSNKITYDSKLWIPIVPEFISLFLFQQVCQMFAVLSINFVIGTVLHTAHAPPSMLPPVQSYADLYGDAVMSL